MTLARVVAAGLALAALALLAFVGLNAAAVLRYGRGQAGDVLASVLLVAAAVVLLRAARTLWARRR